MSGGGVYYFGLGVGEGGMYYVERGCIMCGLMEWIGLCVVFVYV